MREHIILVIILIRVVLAVLVLHRIRDFLLLVPLVVERALVLVLALQGCGM
jgi:hypothetical protein